MKLILAGDSTVAACPSFEYPMSGWGAVLPPLVWRWAAVHNLAKGGATTESFREEGLWQAALDAAGPGDAVVLQFGHNDQKREHLAARGGYAENLRAMVAEIRARGARPVLCTSVERRHFAGAVLEESLGEYPAVVRELGEELQADVVDLTVFTRDLYTSLGPERSVALFAHLARGEHQHWTEGLEDDTHFSVQGARAVAEHVAGQLELHLRAPVGRHA